MNQHPSTTTALSLDITCVVLSSIKLTWTWTAAVALWLCPTPNRHLLLLRLGRLYSCCRSRPHNYCTHVEEINYINMHKEIKQTDSQDVLINHHHPPVQYHPRKEEFFNRSPSQSEQRWGGGRQAAAEDPTQRRPTASEYAHDQSCWLAGNTRYDLLTSVIHKRNLVECRSDGLSVPEPFNLFIVFIAVVSVLRRTWIKSIGEIGKLPLWIWNWCVSDSLLGVSCSCIYLPWNLTCPLQSVVEGNLFSSPVSLQWTVHCDLPWIK